MTPPPDGNRYDQVVVTGGIAHLGNQYNTIYQDQQQEQRRKLLQLLTSLRYDEMNARFNEISDAGDETFEWIFNHAEQSRSGPSALSAWLVDDTPMFLVQGKAGSGKSTLMKFVFEHNVTRSLLQNVSGSQPLLLFHSFYIVGHKNQHNLKGLLASFLYHILSERRDLVSVCYIIPRLDQKFNLSDWSEKDLQRLLLTLCRKLSSLYIFIDGLDEINPREDLDKLINLIRDVQQLGTSFKFCLSSRPQPYIIQSVGRIPALNLQDLTKDDIFNHVQSILRSKAFSLSSTTENETHLQTITALICQKADGVFLWVHYVLRNVCDGLRIGDDLSALQQRITILPSAIGDLYRHMWNLQNNDNVIHAKEASSIFSFGRHFPMPLFHLTVALKPSLNDHYLQNMNTVDELYLRSVCDQMARLVQQRSAGLIECFEVEAEDDDDLKIEESNFWGQKGISAHKTERWRRMKVQYIHRTVHDFLTETEEGQQIVHGETTSTSQEVDCKWLEAHVACFVEDVRGFSLEALYEMCFSEAWLSQMDCALLDIVDAMGRRLMLDRMDPRSRIDRHNWVFDMQTSGFIYSFHSDFPGLVAGNSRSCLQHLLLVHGQTWSAYYKGYLAFCTIIHILWNVPVWKSDIVRMIEILYDLKQAGADFITPHPYSSESIGVFVIRSPVVRLLQEICITILRPRDHRVGIEMVSDLLMLFGGLKVSGQKFTIFWTDHFETTSNGFGVSPEGYPCCMLVFDAGTVLSAFSHLLQSIHQTASHDIPSSIKHIASSHSQSAIFGHVPMGGDDGGSTSSTGDLRQSLMRILPNLIERIRVIRYSAHPNDNDTDDEANRFAECNPKSNRHLFDVMLRGDNIDVFDEEIFADIGPPAWPESDVNFEDKWEELRPFILPLDPHVDIGPHNWMEKGSLKDYFAFKKSRNS